MHLSLLSDASVSHDAAFANGRSSAHTVGPAHREGVMRGLLFLAAISIPLCLALVTGHARLADASAGYAQTFEAQR